MNFLFIITHDIGRRYGCYGNSNIKSPNIDQLAKESVQFNNHFCHFPLCGPSRANIFSGMRPLSTERFDNEAFFPEFRKKMGQSFKTLPEIFKENCYETFGAGLVFHDVDDPPSWSIPFWRPELPKLPGNIPNLMRIFNENSPNPWVNKESFELIKKRIENLKKTGIDENTIYTPSGLRKVKGPPVEAGKVTDNIYFDGQTTERILEYLDTYKGSKPFFVAAGYTAAHLPWNSPAKYWSLYKEQSLTLPENQTPPDGCPEWAMGDSEPAQYYTQHGYEKPWRATKEQSLELMHGYYAAISYIDAMIGKLLEKLKSKNLYKDTVIVLVSDHGFHTAEHGYWGKHNLWDKSLQVPLIMKPAENSSVEVIPGVRENGLTEHVDIFPTLCDIANIEKPTYLQGKSLLPVLVNPASRAKDAAFSHRKHQWHDRIKAYSIANSIRTERYRYTEYLDSKGRILHREFFDYNEDPEETENMINKKAYSEVINYVRSKTP